MDFFHKPGTILCIAKSGSGKSNAFKSIVCNLYYKGLVSDVVVFSYTLHNHEYDWVKPQHKFEGINLEVINKITNYRKELIEAGNQVKPICMIFDDVAGDKNLRDPNVLNALVTRARHYNIYLFYSVQYANLVPPVVRENCSIVMLFKVANQENAKQLWTLTNYGKSLKEFQEFCESELCDYWFLVYNKNEQSNDVNKTHRLLKAPKPEDLKNFVIR